MNNEKNSIALQPTSLATTWERRDRIGFCTSAIIYNKRIPSIDHQVSNDNGSPIKLSGVNPNVPLAFFICVSSYCSCFRQIHLQLNPKRYHFPSSGSQTVPSTQRFSSGLQMVPSENPVAGKSFPSSSSSSVAAAVSKSEACCSRTEAYRTYKWAPPVISVLEKSM